LGIIIAIAIFSGLVSGIRINEVMPHTNNSFGNDWVEIYNPSNEQVNLTNWIVGDNSNNKSFNLTLSNQSYGLVVDDNISFNGSLGCSAIYLFFNNSNISCFQLSAVGGSGLNEGGEEVYLYNETGSLISNFSWNTSIQETGKSWSFNGTVWQACMPTPGYANNCSSILQNTTNTTTPPPDSDEIYIEIDYDEEVRNGEEFEVEVNAYELEDEDYDIKVYITPEDDNKIISETYDEEDDDWSSSTYYINEILSGPGDDTATLKLRIDEDYVDFSGDAKIYAKIRDSGGSVIDSVKGDIEILEKEEEEDDSGSTTSTTTTTQTTNTTSQTTGNSPNNSNLAGNVVRLNSGKQEDIKTSNGKILYKSRQEYFKEYGIYAFALVCIAIIIALLIKS